MGDASRDAAAAGACGATAWRRAHAAVHRQQLERLHQFRTKASSSVEAGSATAEKKTLPTVVVFVAREGRWSGLNAALRFSGGLADRFAGLVSLFALAISTGTRSDAQSSRTACKATACTVARVRPPCYQS